jgi:hypothetical protein
MRVGTENRKVLAGAVVCAALALVFLARMVVVLSANPPAASAATRPEQPAQGPQARRVPRGAPAQLAASNPLDPTLRLDRLEASEATEYKGSGRNIFAEYVPPPPPAPKIDPRTDHRPAAPPQPPPIPLKFYGFASRPGEPKRVFLSSGDDVFIAAEGEIVNRRYRVLHIGVNSVEIEDVLSNNRQTIPLTQS